MYELTWIVAIWMHLDEQPNPIELTHSDRCQNSNLELGFTVVRRSSYAILSRVITGFTAQEQMSLGP